MSGTLNLANAFGSGGLTTNTLGTTDPNIGGITYGAGNVGQVQEANTSGYTAPSSSGSAGYSAPAAPALSTYQQSVLGNLQPSLDVLHSNTNAAGDTASRDYGQGILNFITQQRLGQNAIDTQGVQNELSRKQGTLGVLDMVGQGIRSGGVVLGNKNAGNSSATEALARAYGILGRTQQTGVNNQFAQGENSIANAQSNFGIQQAAGVQGLNVSKKDAVDAIVQNANTQLQYLQNQLIYASLPDRIDIQAQQQQIRDTAAAQLAAHDPELSSGVAGITPSTADANRLKAQQLATAGTAPDNQFSYTSAIPAQFQGTGPEASSLPLFALPGSKKQTV